LLAIEAIKYNDQPCLEINDLWQALHHSIEDSILDEIESILSSSWASFSKNEFKNAIDNCNNLFTPSPDKLLWSHLKHILHDNKCLNNNIRIANACLDLGFWPSYFKMSTMIVIPKPNKSLYDTSKFFKPIVLLNTLGKLIEKIIGDRLQFHTISNNFIHQSQLGGLKFKSMMDIEIALTHIICSDWVKNLSISTLVFNISKFFPFLNHHLLTFILEKVDFDLHVVKFFSNYLVGRKTNYFWNSFTSSLFDVNIRVDQGSALSPILSAFYLSPFLYILENCLKNLKIPISILSFVDDNLFIFPISLTGSFHSIIISTFTPTR